MTARRRRLDRVGLFMAGLVLGLLVTAAVLYWFVDRSRTRVVEEQVRVRLGLPEEAFDLEDVEEDGSLRIVLREVALLDRAGDTVLTAPRVRARLVAATLSADEGPIVVDDVRVEDPFLRLFLRPDGEWNAFDIFRAEAAGEEVRFQEEGEEARSIVFRDVRIADGRVRIARPASPAPTGRFASLRQPETIATPAGPYQVTWLRDLDAVLPAIRVAGPGGWRVEVASLDAEVTNPDTRIVQLSGWLEQDPDETLRFDLDTFRTPDSRLAGSGRVRFGDDGPTFDLQLRAAPLAFSDLQGMGIPIPGEGTATFSLDAETLSGGRTRLAFSDAAVSILDSRLAGDATVITGGEELVFTDTRLTLDPLQLQDLQQLGFADSLPVLGAVSGTVTSVDDLAAGTGGPLRIDLLATLVPPSDPDAAPSEIAARGLVRWVPGEDPIRFSDLRVEAQPLRLATLSALAPDNQFLRGTVLGGATISGSMQDVRIEDGDLTYVVGTGQNPPQTVLRGLSGRFVMGETPRWEFRARAEPLALATLTALFPALPFRGATLSGPIAASGVGDDVRFDVDLAGAAGAVEAGGSLTLGEPLRFDVSGRLEAFRAGALLTTSTPVEGPLTGTFSARGTAEDFQFAVDMTQAGGSFDLAGRIRRPGGGPMVFDVAGRVDNFRIGALLGRPELLPGPVSGPIAISGGGGGPIEFDVALTGAQGTFEARGSFIPGEVPVYAVRGRVQGLDLSALPGMAALPATRLTGTVDVEGRGTTPETFDGRIVFDAAPGSTVAGLTIEAGTARIVASSGVLRVEQLAFAIPGVRVTAEGAMGLTRAADDVLRFRVDAENLSVLAAVLPPPGRFEPEIAGSLQAAGWVGGTLRYPEIAFNATGRGLRWETYRVETLAAEGRLQRGATQWTGTLDADARQLALGFDTFRSLELQAVLAPEQASFGVDLRRDEQTDLRASGVLEMDGLAVSGVVLRDMALRIADVEWLLASDEARLARTADGVVIRDLRLERTGAATGFIQANGILPTEGIADLRIEAAGIDMAELRRIVPALPEAGGTLAFAADITGPVDAPRMDVRAGIRDLTYGGVRTDSLSLAAEYAAERMEVVADVVLDGRAIVDAEATVPMRLALGGLVPTFEVLRTRPMQATLVADSLPVQLVASAVPQFLADGEGRAYAGITVSGTPDDPVVTGSAALNQGAFTVVPLGARWRDVEAALLLEGETITVQRAVARSGENGEASVTGTVLLDDPQAPAVNLEIRSDNFLVIDNPDVAELQAEAGLRVSGRLPQASLTGYVTLEDGTIYIPELGEETEADIVDVDVGALGADTVSAAVATATGMFGPFVPTNLEVRIGESVWLASDDARIQITGSLQVYEAGGAPRVYGELVTTRGTYTLALGPIEREFEIVEGTVQFAGTPQLNPRLDITARHEVRAREPGAADLAVLVHLGGTMQNPTIDLSSETRPPLPESELLTLLLFGRRSTELANIPQEFTQGIILEQLVGGLITSELERAFASLGIFDYVRLRTRPTGVGFAGVTSIGGDIFAYASLEAGKEIFEDFFAVLEIVDLLSDPRLGISAEWQATRTWSLRGAWEPVRRDPLLLNLDTRARQILVEARRRWEYGRPPPQDTTSLVPAAPPADEPRPGELSTPTGEPPPEEETP